jgi:hypothetical protein
MLKLKIIVDFRSDLRKMMINTDLWCKRYDFLTKKTQNYHYRNYCPGWQEFKSIHMAFYVNPSWACAHWKLINYALTWARPNLFLSIFMPVAWMLKFVFVYLANTAVLCYALIIICCCQVHDYIYWIISTENDHWHHHKFIKYEKRLRKEGKNMLGLPIKQNLCHFSASLDA